jgi:hypothetical protein
MTAPAIVCLLGLPRRDLADGSRRDCPRLTLWVNRLAGGIDRTDLETTARVLEELCCRLELSEHRRRRRR